MLSTRPIVVTDASSVTFPLASPTRASVTNREQRFSEIIADALMTEKKES